MKEVGIAILAFLTVTVMSIGFDTTLGNRKLDATLQSTLNPFYVMETAEIVIFIFLILGIFVTPVRLFFQKRAKANKSDKQN